MNVSGLSCVSNKVWVKDFLTGLTKQRKEHSFRERKIFIRKEHFITLLSVLNSFKCLFIIRQHLFKDTHIENYILDE